MPAKTSTEATDEDSVQQAVLLASGAIVTVNLHASYAAYPRAPAQIENICGHFTHYLDTSPFAQVVGCSGASFGRQKELYHIEGNVTVHQGRASFMGARGHAGLARLARALRLEGAAYTVHMVVLCMKLGCRAHVTSNGLLESNVSRWDRQIRVHGRILEQANILRFKVRAFTGEFKFPRELIPDNNDWAVTGRGTLLARMTWAALPYTAESEARILEFTNRVGGWLTECCGDLSAPDPSLKQPADEQTSGPSLTPPAGEGGARV